MVNKKIFFWGSKPLGYKCFKYLLDETSKRYRDVKIIGACISEKDLKKDGIKRQDISGIARKHNIPIFTERVEILPKGDLGICIGYPHRIPLETIHKYKNGVINLHFAPLPYYRGSKTLSHAILNREKRYGITFHYIDQNLDTGPIIAIKWSKLSKNKTAEKIEQDLEKLAFNYFKSYLDKMLTKKLPSTSQEDIIKLEKVKPRFYTRSSIDKLYKISLDDSFDKIYEIVRALSLRKSKLPYIEKGNKRIYLSIKNND